MKIVRDTITIQTAESQQFLDITKHVRDSVARSQIRNGVLLVGTLHTTLALFVNEFQTALIRDVGALLEKLVPYRDGYVHDDPRYSDCDRRNGHAHLRTMLFGRHVSLGISEGEPMLGDYQSLIIAELDGPRQRTIGLQIMGE
jgi:secondary thiamine-phosphate synthase enzyme